MKTPKELADEYANKHECGDQAWGGAYGGFLAGYQAGFKEAKKYWANQPKYDADPIEKLIEDKFWEQPKPKAKL
jgi:hypothetical protein